MKTTILLLLLVVVCQGDHAIYRQLIDLLRRHEADAAKRHVTAAKRHDVTAAKRHVTATKRHDVTAAIRHDVTADKRHDLKDEIGGWSTVHTHQFETATPPASENFIEEGEFAALEEAFLFPGSHYLIDMIRKHCESGEGLSMDKEEISENFQLPECQTDRLRQIFLVLKELRDPHGVALLVTRTFMMPLLMERMKCPATILDMAIVRTILLHKDRYMDHEDQSLFTFFREVAPLIDPQLGPFADDIATAGVHELHGAVFGETLEFLWKYGLKDLAYASHNIFNHLHFFFDNVLNDGTDFRDRATDFRKHFRDAASVIKCPSSAEVIQYHKEEVFRFKNIFGLMETEQICLKVADFITGYVSKTLPGYTVNHENNLPLYSVCEAVELTINDIVSWYADYEDFLFSMKIEDLEKLLAEMLSEDEWTLVEEALRRLDFVERR